MRPYGGRGTIALCPRGAVTLFKALMDLSQPPAVVDVSPVTAEATAAPAAAPAPQGGATPETLTEMQRRSRDMLQDMLGMQADTPLAAVIAFPASDDGKLAEAKTVEEAMPLIDNMIRAEKIAGGIKKPYPRRTALKHQHIVAFMLCNPFATTTEICSFFGISPTTLTNITKSDTFKALVQAHRVTIDSGIGADLQAQLRDTMAAAIEVVQKAVVTSQDPDYALSVMDKTANRMGLGAKHQTGPMVQVNVITPEMIAAARASRRLLPGAS